jgi:hypothetical protein
LPYRRQTHRKCFSSSITLQVRHSLSETDNRLGLWYLPTSISRLWQPTRSRVIETRNEVRVTFTRYGSSRKFFLNVLYVLSLFPPSPLKLYSLIKLECHSWMNWSLYEHMIAFLKLRSQPYAAEKESEKGNHVMCPAPFPSISHVKRAMHCCFQ